MTGNTGQLRAMCQLRALLCPYSNHPLSFAAHSAPLSTGMVAALGLIVLVFAALDSPLRGQEASPPPSPGPASPVKSPAAVQSTEGIGATDASRGAPLTLTFQDALERARSLDPQLTLAATDAESAHQDRVQSRAALLPSVSFTGQYLFTQGPAALFCARPR